MEWREPLRLLVGNRRFAALWGSDLVATIGDRVHRVALAALVYELTGSMTVAGLAFWPADCRISCSGRSLVSWWIGSIGGA